MMGSTTSRDTVTTTPHLNFIDPIVDKAQPFTTQDIPMLRGLVGDLIDFNNEDAAGTIVNRRATVYAPEEKNVSTPKTKPHKIFLGFIKSDIDDEQLQPIVYTLEEDGVIPIGRTNRNSSHDRAIILSSKVVSRSHAELSLRDGKWYIRDIGSSSGTFLNNMRLSDPNVVSSYYPIKTGDSVRFGIDYRNSTMASFKSMRFKIEVDDGSDVSAKEFDIEQFHKLKDSVMDTGDVCGICLEDIQPLQGLLMLPCSHMWHFGCIYPLVAKTFPYVECPFCRKVTDLQQ